MPGGETQTEISCARRRSVPEVHSSSALLFGFTTDQICAIVGAFSRACPTLHISPTPITYKHGCGERDAEDSTRREYVSVVRVMCCACWSLLLSSIPSPHLPFSPTLSSDLLHR